MKLEARICGRWAVCAWRCRPGPASPPLGTCSLLPRPGGAPPRGHVCDPALPPLPPRLRGYLQEKSLEHLRLSDRSSLLSEIQALRAQLRMTHLQNQEKLQQLCAALTSAEARGSRQEHQLRRQGEHRPSRCPALGLVCPGPWAWGPPASAFLSSQNSWRSDSVAPPRQRGVCIGVSAGHQQDRVWESLGLAPGLSSLLYAFMLI